MWISDPGYLQMVTEARSTPFTGYPMYILVKKLGAVKQKLKLLHHSKFGGLQGRLEDVLKQLQDTQNALKVDPFNESLISLESERQEERLLRADFSLAAQRAKVDWVIMIPNPRVRIASS